MQPPQRPQPTPDALTAPTSGDTPALPETLPPTPCGPSQPTMIGRYCVLRRLGGGGMGDVYLAHDPVLDRPVAVKLPRFAGAADPGGQLRQRFLREARTASRVAHHPHVCPVYDAGEHDGQPFAVMAYAEGGSLADVLKARGRFEDAGEAVRLVRQAAGGVAALHAHGHLHRDLKPGNILLDREGRPLVSDFGLAKPLSTGDAAAPDAAAPLTADGAVLGTPAYMAPEQAAGEAGPASDVYGLGVVLYHLLTGRTPFVGPPLTQLRQLGTADPPTPTSLRGDLCPGLEAVLLRALARRPEDRYPSAAAFAAALDGWLSGVSTPDRPALTPAAAEAVSPPQVPPIAPRRGAAHRVKIAQRWWTASDGPSKALSRGPATGRRSALVAVAGLLLLSAGIPLVLSLRHIPGGSAVVPDIPAAAWRGYLDAHVWGPEPDRRGLRLKDPGALPLRPGDKVRLEAEVEPAAYLYVVLIDTEGQAAPLYPWKPGRWEERGAEQPRTRLSLPEGMADGGWEVAEGPAGMETLLLLARPTPLPPDAEAELRAALTGLRPQTAQAAQAIVWFENGEVVRGDAERSYHSFEPKRVDDPVLRTQALLKDKLQKQFAYTRAISYSNQGH